LSASQIAATLGSVTRNAVIGKVHRLGLSGRGKNPGSATPKPARPRIIAPAGPLQVVAGIDLPAASPVANDAPSQAPPLPAPVAIPESSRVTILELRESMCRWPLGDPAKPDFAFCGGRAVTGLPYCNHHCAIAYQPAAERRRLRA
ncbi:MAG: GcrA cell cycle regulator, partial [Methylobacteriaceae bacterium]|nr:GcrA cell cycle regulator [Methylobacteriaceae bacterium]